MHVASWQVWTIRLHVPTVNTTSLTKFFSIDPLVCLRARCVWQALCHLYLHIRLGVKCFSYDKCYESLICCSGRIATQRGYLNGCRPRPRAGPTSFLGSVSGTQMPDRTPLLPGLRPSSSWAEICSVLHNRRSTNVVRWPRRGVQLFASYKANLVCIPRPWPRAEADTSTQSKSASSKGLNQLCMQV